MSMSGSTSERRRKYSAVVKRDGEKCAWCESADDLTLDHIVPRSRGGANAIVNLQLLCKPCNQEKGNRLDAAQVTPSRLRKAFRKQAVKGLLHHRHCDPNYCFCECPVYLAQHPELARSLGVTA